MRWARHGAAVIAAAVLGTLAGCTDQQDGNRAADGARRAERDVKAAVPKAGTGGFSLVATGDLLVHDSIIRQARADAGGSGYDFGPMLAAAAPLVSEADLAICHMETVYGPRGGPYAGYPLFHTPPQIAKAVRAMGYDACSTASNHSLDAGPEGVSRTLDAMDAVGLKHAGSARTARERARPTLLQAGGATVAQLAYTYGTNGIPVPKDRPWLVNTIDPERVIADARAARDAGADVVTVSLHWGTEWQQAPDEQQLALARQLTRSERAGRRDIDLIIGTHNHVPQAYEKVNGTWVVYGLGDQIAGRMDDHRGQQGSAARFTFAPPTRPGAPWSVRKAEFIPYVMENDPRLRLVDLGKALADDPHHADYARARAEIRDAVLERGAGAAGLRMGH
ncbi:CapA family protein [Streptomyces zagrosensis]|uniref:Poly-gamma-glutamate synthesis protein (Capsule biosynthesis protein) n=1 Tax=Streptomyces zagrosensis TaxID=1042984 RepID=A0A7W9V0S8_9ACTN|nr:CapA family protein [Streptomyces zagrosensis]MBB5937049.1 poly-gamma-glutamate synthesis protein (capsule biosynthesis protein) [Streptomyces zagrosensis]